MRCHRLAFVSELVIFDRALGEARTRSPNGLRLSGIRDGFETALSYIFPTMPDEVGIVIIAIFKIRKTKFREDK